MSVENPRWNEATDIIAVINPSAPVFVDTSGRRRKRIRILFGALGAATLAYGALVATSLVGGPLQPQQLLPFSELVNNLPALDQQDSGSKPGAKNTPAANQQAVTSAEKIAGSPVAGRPIPVPVPSGSAGGSGGPGATVSATPPTPQPSASVTRRPGATAGPTPTVTVTAQPGATATIGGTALPGTNQTAAPGQPAVTAQDGLTSTVLPAATLSVSPAGAGIGGTAAGLEVSVALPGAIAGLGLA